MRRHRFIIAIGVIFLGASVWAAVSAGHRDHTDAGHPIVTSLESTVAVGESSTTTTVASTNAATTLQPVPAVPVRGHDEVGAIAAAVAIVHLDEQRLRNVAEARELTLLAATTAAGPALADTAVRDTSAIVTETPGVSVFAQALRTRTISATATDAVIDVWWVRIYFAPGRPYAGDVWGTTRYTLVWERGAWRESGEQTRLGPFPRHSDTAVNHLSGSAFAAALTGFQAVTEDAN